MWLTWNQQVDPRQCQFLDQMVGPPCLYTLCTVVAPNRHGFSLSCLFFLPLSHSEYSLPSLSYLLSVWQHWGLPDTDWKAARSLGLPSAYGSVNFRIIDCPEALAFAVQGLTSLKCSEALISQWAHVIHSSLSLCGHQLFPVFFQERISRKSGERRKSALLNFIWEARGQPCVQTQSGRECSGWLGPERSSVLVPCLTWPGVSQSLSSVPGTVVLGAAPCPPEHSLPYRMQALSSLPHWHSQQQTTHLPWITLHSQDLPTSLYLSPLPLAFPLYSAGTLDVPCLP